MHKNAIPATPVTTEITITSGVVKLEGDGDNDSDSERENEGSIEGVRLIECE
jgi:hypothetical protein